MRILVADDDSLALRNVTRWLENWGYEPVLAQCGNDAVRILLGDAPPAVAILKWALHDRNGTEITRAVRASTRGSSVYVIAKMVGGSADVIAAREAGIDDLLRPDFEPSELQFRIARAVSFAEGRLRPRTQMPPPAPAEGTLAGRYRLEHPIGESRLATVWRGTHLALGINVAIKFVKSSLVVDFDYPTFEAEARKVAQLRSDHVLRVYGHGSHEGRPYFVTDYFRGETMNARLARAGLFTAEDTVAALEPIARTLHDAHGRGVVHGDIRPETLFFGDPSSVRARLAEFDFARAMFIEDVRSRQPCPQFVTPEYLCEDAVVSPALDMWSLAACAFFAMTGVRPFVGATMGEVFAKVCAEALPMPSRYNSALSPAVDAWFVRACARRPGQRFSDPVEMMCALRSTKRSVSRPSIGGMRRSPGASAIAPLPPRPRTASRP